MSLAEQKSQSPEVTWADLGPELGEVWAVLVAGDHRGGVLGAHTSLKSVCRAYGELKQFIPSTNIIVLAEVNATIKWLRSAAETGLPLWSSRTTIEDSKAKWRTRLEEMEFYCEPVISDGGPTYDGKMVNPGTLYHVLRGIKTESIQTVLPVENLKSVVIGIFSHGDSHRSVSASSPLIAKVPCDICQKPHRIPEAVDEDASPTMSRHAHSSIYTREWFFHLPHPSPTPETYAYVAHAEAQSPEYLVYWQMLFQCYYTILSRRPQPAIVVINQYCLSGGASKFLMSEAFKRKYMVHTWPLFLVTTAAELSVSLGSFFSVFFEALAMALTSRNRTDRFHNMMSLRELFMRVEKEYWKREQTAFRYNALYRHDIHKFGQVQNTCGLASFCNRVPIRDIFLPPMASPVGPLRGSPDHSAKRVRVESNESFEILERSDSVSSMPPPPSRSRGGARSSGCRIQ